MSKLTLKEKIREYMEAHPKFLKTLKVINISLFVLMLTLTIGFIVLVGAAVFDSCDSNKVEAEELNVTSIDIFDFNSNIQLSDGLGTFPVSTTLNGNYIGFILDGTTAFMELSVQSDEGSSFISAELIGYSFVLTFYKEVDVDVYQTVSVEFSLFDIVWGSPYRIYSAPIDGEFYVPFSIDITFVNSDDFYGLYLTNFVSSYAVASFITTYDGFVVSLPSNSNAALPLMTHLFPNTTVFFTYSMAGSLMSDEWILGLNSYDLSLFPSNTVLNTTPFNLSSYTYIDNSFISTPVYECLSYTVDEHYLFEPFSYLQEDSNGFFDGLTFKYFVVDDFYGLENNVGSLPLTWDELRNSHIGTGSLAIPSYFLIVAYYNGEAGGYDLGYNDGYAAGEEFGWELGYVAGSDIGYDIGYEDGNSIGYEKGYDIGFERGQNNSINYNWLMFAVDSFLGFNFFGNFGIGTLLSIVVGGWLLIIFLRIFAGG